MRYDAAAEKLYLKGGKGETIRNGHIVGEGVEETLGVLDRVGMGDQVNVD